MKKDPDPNQKTHQQHADSINQSPSAGPDGVSISPPAYGMDLVGYEFGSQDFSPVSVHVPNPFSVTQPKFTISQPRDQLEQEADHAAEMVTRMPEPIIGTNEQKEGRKRTTEPLVERNPTVSKTIIASREAYPQHQLERSNQPLSSQEKAFFEPRFGHDFSQVRIHANAKSGEMADALNADAFTVGRDIYFGAGKLQPQNMESGRLLGHELAHVIQQSRMGPALQPKLKITGKTGDVSRAISLLNAGLGNFYNISVDKSGEVKIEPIRAAFTSSKTGPNAQQQALANRLTTVINDPKDVLMTVSVGSNTLVGSYATGDFDIGDIEAVGVNALIHEIEEQYQKQVKGVAYGSETTGAHGEGIKAESEVKGAKRGAQTVVSSTANADGTLNAVVEIPYTYPDGKVKTMVMTITKNNVASVTWK